MNVPFAAGEEVQVASYPCRIVRLLGKGKGGWSFLVELPEELGKGEAVLKQIHHEPCAYYQFGDKMQSELNDYQRLTEAQVPLPKLLAYDLAKERLLKEYVAGPTIYELALTNEVPEVCFQEVRQWGEQLRQCGLNIDYFPTNFIVQADHTLVYIDYECNEYSDKWNFANWGVRYWSATPELLEYAASHNCPDGT